MGVSHSMAEFQGKLNRLAQDYADEPLAIVKEGSLIVKNSVKAIAPARLRGVGKKGAKLDVRYNVAGAGIDAKSLVFAVGPFQLIENDTKPHPIPKVRGARARTRYAVIPGGAEGGVHGMRGVRTRVDHPGTQGKHPWAKGVEAAAPAVQRLFEVRGELALRRVFS